MAPVIVSPVTNNCWEEMKSLLLPKSSTSTVAVAFDVEPVIVSLTVNLPLDPAPASYTILLPLSSKRCEVVWASKSILSIVTVTPSSPASKNW